MASMLRPFVRGNARGAAFLNRANGVGRSSAAAPASRLMSTQSGDDAKPPTALAKLHLEDGTTLTGRSFGSHESMTGEASFVLIVLFYVSYRREHNYVSAY